MKILKRDNKLVEFNQKKIQDAICKAMKETDTGVDMSIASNIANIIEQKYTIKDITPTVEDVQDDVEVLLAENGRFDAAKRYVLYRNEREKVREKGWEMNELQRDVWENKYRHNGESFNEFVNRVSGNDEKIAKLIRNKDFLFGGRILAGRGIDRKVSMANCTTLPPVEDNIESIFNTAKELARMYSYGNGVGIDISKLRPRGSQVNNASKTSTGAVSFCEIFDSVGNVIGAEGRRAALLIMLDALHDDIDEFITVKSDTNKITNANLSVKTTEEFMKLDTDKKRDTMKKIAEYAWDNGEPAVLHWDNIENWHLLSHDPNYRIDCTNACTEFTTTAYGTCLLGSINLANFIINPYTDDARFDYERLADVSKIVTNGMNDVLLEAIPTHPLPQQREVAANYRQIGVGIMGLGSMFIKLGIEYGSEESIKITSKVMESIRNSVIFQSSELARKYGHYPKYNYEYIKKSPYFQSLPSKLKEKIKEDGLYNSTFISIAPAGTLSLLADVTNGLEPMFARSYNRTTKSLGSVEKTHKVYQKEIKELMDNIGITKEEDLPGYCIESYNINPKNRIDVQAEIQKYTDLAISSTVNLGENVTPEEIEEIYTYAYKVGLKGVSVFRENCKRVGILQKNNNKQIVEEKKDDTSEIEMIQGVDCST